VAPRRVIVPRILKRAPSATRHTNNGSQRLGDGQQPGQLGSPGRGAPGTLPVGAGSARLAAGGFGGVLLAGAEMRAPAGYCGAGIVA